MPEIADIFRKYGPVYIERYGNRMPEFHREAIYDISNCRTEAMGSHVYVCEKCHKKVFHYHSCRNRHCPKCQGDRANKWREKQMKRLLPTVTYHLVTFTIPEEFRQIARSNQKLIYGILFRTSAAALKKLAADPRFIGGQIGMTGILHTWTRALLYHPHVHFIVPGGGYDEENEKWHFSNKKFLVPVKALSKIFRAKFRDEFRKTPFSKEISANVWGKDWVVHSKPVGSGKHALEYLSAYVYRVAITDKRIVRIQDDEVTFRYRESETGILKTQKLHSLEFIRRFLWHVLPPGFVKIRHFGFLSPVKTAVFQKAFQLLIGMLILFGMLPKGFVFPGCEIKSESIDQNHLRCKHCGGRLVLIEINKTGRGPPVPCLC